MKVEFWKGLEKVHLNAVEGGVSKADNFYELISVMNEKIN